MDLASASAIVTGGAGGFGSATVNRLAQMGAKVVIADVSDEPGEALVIMHPVSSSNWTE
jgi:NAD(P)-dependent dehydrogenase (short-subunit alcohol dehydrogenase family)